MEQEEEDEEEEEKEVDFNPSFCLIKSFCTINLKKQQNLNYNQDMKMFLTNFKMFARTLRLETKRWAGLVPPNRFTFREKQEVKDDDITSSEVRSLSSCRCLRWTSSR